MVDSGRLIKRGDVYWASLPIPRGSEPGYDRPVIIIQRTAINNSAIRTILCIPLTTNLQLASAPGNTLLSPRTTGLPKQSVANVSQIYAIDKRFLKEYVATLPEDSLKAVLDGVHFFIGR